MTEDPWASRFNAEEYDLQVRSNRIYRRLNDRMAARNRELFAEKHVFVLNLMSSPGSGKTTIVRRIGEIVPDFVFLPQDNYYRDPVPAGLYTFDHPDAFDHDLMRTQLQQLVEGQAIEYPLYDYSIHSRKGETRRVGPHQIVIVEGILLLAVPEIRSLRRQ